MRRTFLAGLALISLAACGGGAKEQPKVAEVRHPTVKPHATKAKAKVKARATTPKGKKATTPVRKPSRKAPAPVDTTAPFNPLQNH
jgi:hypothetical protein